MPSKSPDFHGNPHLPAPESPTLLEFCTTQPDRKTPLFSRTLSVFGSASRAKTPDIQASVSVRSARAMRADESSKSPTEDAEKSRSPQTSSVFSRVAWGPMGTQSPISGRGLHVVSSIFDLGSSRSPLVKRLYDASLPFPGSRPHDSCTAIAIPRTLNSPATDEVGDRPSRASCTNAFGCRRSPGLRHQSFAELSERLYSAGSWCYPSPRPSPRKRVAITLDV